MDRREVVRPDGSVRLTDVETKLLAYLAARPGVTVTREQLLQEVWGYAPGLITRAPHHAVTRLRKKIEVDPSAPAWLQSVYGAGYRLDLPDRDSPSPTTEAKASPEASAPVVQDRRSTFVGRTGELDRLSAWLEGPERLLAVVGPGGVGKTRLCARFASARHDAFPGGSWLVELEGRRSEEEVLTAVAGALGLQLGDAPGHQIGAALEARGRVLLVLDDLQCEAPFIQQWLDRAPEARFLVTGSRRPALPSRSLLLLKPMSSDDALTLLGDRSRDAGAPDASRVKSAGAAEALVEQLDGLPLAIELAAARMRMLGLEELLARLDQRFRLLRGTGGDVDPRTATMRGVLDGSWSQLEPWARLGLAQCSQFRGSFTLESAEAVLDVAECEDAPWAMDVLQRLQDQSLLEVESVERGRTCFRLLHTVRDYAAEQLARPDGAERTGPEAVRAVRKRHCEHYAALGSNPRLEAVDGPNAWEALGRLLRQRDNLTAALDWALDAGSLHQAVHLARALQEVAKHQGPLTLVQGRVNHILTLPGSVESERIDLAARQAELMVLAGDVGPAKETLLRLQEGAAALDSPRLLAKVFVVLGNMEIESDAPNAARPHLEAAREAAVRADDGLLQAMATMSLGSLEQTAGRPDAAEELYRDALVRVRRLGNSRLEGVLLLHLGSLDMDRGRLEAAHVTFEEALASMRRVGARRHEGSALGNLGALYLEMGRLKDARRCLEEALVVHREVGALRLEGAALGNLGTLCVTLGDGPSAQGYYLESIAIHEGLGNRGFAAIMRGNLAEVHLQAGRLEDAERCVSRAVSTCSELGLVVAQAVFLGLTGQVCEGLGLPCDADRSFDESEALLRSSDRPGELGKLLCRRGKVFAVRGDTAAAEATLEEATVLSTRLQVTPESELARGLVELRQMLARAP